ncbi:hypothetical protein MBANPS3_006349 [Mucor bainieri]
MDRLIQKKIARKSAKEQLLALPLPKNEKKFAEAISSLITKLPTVPLDKDVGEMELCTRYIDAVLSSLFDDPDACVFFRWTNESALESKQSFNPVFTSLYLSLPLYACLCASLFACHYVCIFKSGLINVFGDSTMTDEGKKTYLEVIKHYDDSG